MESIFAIVLWPFLLFGMMVIFASAPSGSEEIIAGLSPFIVIIGFFWIIQVSRRKVGTANPIEHLRKALIATSIALLIPITVKYLILSLGTHLFSIVIGFLISYGVGIWGLTIRNNKTVYWGNLSGALIALFYCFVQIWALGEGARIIASGLALIVAVVIAVVNFKEKLT